MLDKTSTCVSVVLGVTLAMASTASAQEAEPEAAATVSAATGGTDQLTLPKSRLLLDAFVGISLSSGAVFEPFSLSPDLWYGATDDITVGLIHSGVGATGFLGASRSSLCLAGSESCGDVYSGFGVDVRYKLKTGMLAWAADGGLYVRAFDPFQLAIKLGAIGRWTSGKIAVELAPNLFFGLTNRSPEPVMMVVVEGNQEVLHLPVTALYAVASKASVALQTGVVLPFQNTGDSYAIPLSLGGHFRANDSLSVNLAFSLVRLAGGGEGTGFDTRTLTLGGTYAF